MLVRFGLLPWDYGARNLFRRPLRTGLTLGSLTMVVMVIFVVLGFVRGLERSLALSGDSQAVLVYSLTAKENIETSSIPARTPELLQASLPGIQRRFSNMAVSPELLLGTNVMVSNGQKGFGIIRGVTPKSCLVRRSVRIVEGHWPGPGEVMVGRLTPAKLGLSAADFIIGKEITIENQPWTISGLFQAEGSAFEAEIWCPLSDFQQALKRQDISLVAILLQPKAKASEVELFCKQRTDLELQAIRETDYFRSLQKFYLPLRVLAWLVVGLVATSGTFAGLNMMFANVTGRMRELAVLQAIGFRQRAIFLSLIQEGFLLALTASVIAAYLAVFLLNGLAVRFTMGAFQLNIDGGTLWIGSLVGIGVGVLGTIPPMLKSMSSSVSENLKSL